MKYQLPFILCYDDLIELYSGHIIPRVLAEFKNITTPKGLEQVQKEVLATIKKNKPVIDEIEDVMLKFTRHLIMEDPQVYVARTKDVKTDIEYFTAKTFWPLKGGKKKEVKIYLGKASDYNNDTKSKKARNEALIKMRQTLARRIREDSL